MATPTPATPGTPATPASGGEARPRLGRPPRISRAMIAEAAHELGLEGLTLRAVADHLGVSIAALYHHVASKDDLMRLAAEYSVARVPLPEDRGQHWAVWLSEWADYNLHAFVSQPGLLTQYIDGAVSAAAIAGSIDTILRVLVRQGFTVLEANAAYELVTSCALGTAVGVLREREAARSGRRVPESDGRPPEPEAAPEPEPGPEPEAGLEPGEGAGTGTGTESGRAAGTGSDDLPYLRQLHEALAEHGREPFPTRVATVIYGIALRKGLDLAPVRAVLEAEGRDGRASRRSPGTPA